MLPFSLQLSFRHAVFPRYSTHALTFVLNIYNNQCKLKHKIHLSLNDERERNSFLHTKLIIETGFLISTTILCQSSTWYFKLRNSVLKNSYPHLAALHPSGVCRRQKLKHMFKNFFHNDSL